MPGDQYFLDPADETDDSKFRASKREAVSVIPLIDGVATFKAMEVAMASATTSVHVAVWSAKADFPLQAKDDANKALKTAGYKGVAVTTWSELLAAVASRGVEVCISMTDFDPILQSALHENCWRAYSVFRAAAAKAKATTLQVLCARHDAHFSPPFLIELAIVSPALNKLIAKLNGLPKAAGISRINTMPGLWPFVDYNATTSTFSRTSGVTLLMWPVSHHQKMCVVDGKVGFCGGLDPQPGRIDTPAHSGTWHDTHVQVNGPLASDLERNFVARWNSDLTVFSTFIAGAAAAGKTLKADPVTAITATPGLSQATFGPATGQLLRTISSTSVTAGLPGVVRKDIEEAFENAISKAQKFIYIENQYFRDPKIVTWLKATPAAVVVILVVPVAPEEFGTGSPDAVTQKGMFEENANIAALRTALPGRFEAYSMIQRNAASNAHPTNMFGSFQVYVHSKTLIVDDEFAMIGSANTNPRSHRVDTEANIAWYEPNGVTALRVTLWNEQLGSPVGLDTWAPTTFLSHWNTIASANETAAHPPAGRHGYVVHHSTTAFPGADNPDIPKEYTELTDEDPVGVVLV